LKPPARIAPLHMQHGSSEVTMVMSCGSGSAALGAFGVIPVDELAFAVRGRVEDQAVLDDVVVQRLQHVAVLVEHQAADTESALRLGGDGFGRRYRDRRLHINRLLERHYFFLRSAPPKAFGSCAAAVVS
jgi:hypothetical protein